MPPLGRLSAMFSGNMHCYLYDKRAIQWQMNLLEVLEDICLSFERRLQFFLNVDLQDTF